MLTNEIHKKLLDAGLRDLLIEWGTDPFCVDKEVISDSDLDEFIIQKAEERWPDLIDYLCLYVIYDFEEKHWELFIRGGDLSVLDRCHVLDDDPLRGRALLALKIAEVE